MQRLSDVFSPDRDQRKQNEANAFHRDRPFRLTGFSMAAFVGYGEVLLRTVALSAGVFTAAAFGASLIGLPLTIAIWLYLSRGLRELMSQQSPWIRMPVMFLFHASMALLSGFIGLAIVAACTSAMGVNPFVLPCLIAVAVAGAIVLSASIAVACRTQYIAPEGEPILKELPHLIFQAIVGTNQRPFHSKTDLICENKIIVEPFGQEKNEAPVPGAGYEVRSFGKFFGSLFNKNKSGTDSSANNNDNNNEENRVIVYG